MSGVRTWRQALWWVVAILMIVPFLICQFGRIGAEVIENTMTSMRDWAWRKNGKGNIWR